VDQSGGLIARFKSLAQNWSIYTAIGSFSLYFLGYLSLRFHLMEFGVTTDLGVWDERYLFHGANFLAYFGSLIPSALLLAVVACGLFYIPYSLAPRSLRSRVATAFGRWRVYWDSANRLALAGLALSTLAIQLAMRQCLGLDNLLLAPRLPDPGWLATILLDSDLLNLYFIAILAATGVSGALLLGAWTRPIPASPALLGLFVCILCIQVLLIPVNYGLLVTDQELSRVAGIPTQAALNSCQSAWIVWQGKDWTTFLLRDLQAQPERRRLVAIRHSDIKTLDVVSLDPIIRTLFQNPLTCSAAGKD
jgi:hypothetical protein